MDILFYHRRAIGHLIDGCIRWTVARLVPNREMDTLMDFIWTNWVQPFGPMTVLVIDEEGALATEAAGIALERMGVSRKLKAKGQHAKIVERHHEILRRQLHLVESQGREDGLDVSLTRILAEAVFAKNAWLTIGDGTPYKALYGRVPELFRDFDRAGAQAIDDAEGAGESGLYRHIQRLREINLSSIIQATAADRMKRALDARTTPAIQDLELETGDLVDVYRQPPAKDMPGWRGPCTVVSAASPDTGHITVRWQGRDMSVRVADLRRAILFACFLSISQGQDPADLLVAFIAELHDRHVHLGWTRSATG